LIEEYGFTLPRRALAHSAAEAGRLAEEIGFPVALKIASPDILHKTDVGGVELGLSSAPAVEAGFRRLLANVEERAPAAAVQGITVEQMITGGVEVIIGLIYDEQFGPAIMFGLGGVFAEILHDVTFRVLPISRQDAAQMIEEIQGRPILAGYRGQPAVSKEMLVGLLMKVNQMGIDLADRLEAVDLNPVLVAGDEHWVLDAKIMLRDERRPLSVSPPATAHLDTFFKARAIAVVGASATPGKVGNAIMESLVAGDYQGAVYPVNPTRSELLGLPAYPSLSAIPEPVELVVATVSLAQVPDLIVESAGKGIHGMVIISGGGKELGGTSKDVEQQIRELSRQHGVRIVGPNCIGVFDAATRLDVFFQVPERMVRPAKGPVAILSQSGTVGAAVLEALESAGVSKLVSYGNRVDVDEADLLTYLADDPDTGVIALYIEGLEDGRKFLQAAGQVARTKPIVVFKSGRSARGARASLSHTGFFGGTYKVAEGAFKQAGVISVDSIEELAAVAKALALQPRPAGPRVAMISNGAGTMVQAMDLFDAYGLEMPALAQATIERLRAVYPPYYVVQNPVDVTGSASSGDYAAGIEALLDDPNIDIVMPWFVFQDTPLGEDIAEVLGRLSRRRAKPILCGGAGGPFTEKMTRAIEAEGVPVYRTVREWVAAAGGPAGWDSWLKQVAGEDAAA
jgi:3-hydroxypropionyl-CoA synthetase (ADP-forming)